MIDQDIVNRLDNPTVAVMRSAFLAHRGEWAKQWEDVRVIHIDFSDGFVGHIEPQDFKGLNRVQQTKVRNAPSSPLPP